MLKPVFGLLALVTLMSCAPVVTHAPRVERGLTMYGTGGWGFSGCDTSCDLTLIPQGALGFRYGRPAQGGRPGYSVSLTGSLFIVPSDVDVYVQVPTGGSPWATGAGVVVGGKHVMPYVQLGKLDADGSGWYTTQGFAFLSTRDEPIRIFSDETRQVRPRYWSPTLTYRSGRTNGAFQVYVSGALGWSDRIRGRFSENPTAVGREPVRSILLGIILEERMLMPIPIIGWPR